MLAPGVRWFDDWFAVEEVAPGLHAIGEPRYHQTNWNYLVAGDERALLFDTGPGIRDISVVVKALCRKPLTVLPSHLHFDHTGNLHRFPDIAMADLPLLRALQRDGLIHATDDLFRGFREAMVWQPVRVATWLPIGSEIDLGGRRLELLHLPGHSPDSVALLDRSADILLAADFVYPGPLYAQIPGADLAAYRDSAEALVRHLMPAARIYCAHGMPDEAGEHRAPVLALDDVRDLASALQRLRDSRQRPRSWPVNDRMSLLTWDPAFHAWQAR